MIKIYSNEATASGSGTSVAQGATKNVKTNRISAFNRVIISSRKLYAHQLDKNASMKNRCIANNITGHYDDPQKFWLEFETQKAEILDRSSFVRNCTAEGLNPEIVAEHLILEGNATVNRVLKEGFASLKGAHKTYTEPIVRRSYTVEYVDAKPQLLQVVQHPQVSGETISSCITRYA